MRVLHLVTRSHTRGAERVAVELAAALEGAEIEGSVVAIAAAFDGTTDPRIATLLDDAGVGPIALLRASRRLRRLFERERTDVVLAHGGTAAAVAALARRSGGPAIVWQRILPFPARIARPWTRALWRWVALRADAAVVLTADLEAEHRGLGYTGPIFRIGNFRDPERFRAVDSGTRRALLRSELGLPSDAPIIGIVGHLIRQKRPERALEVLQLLRESGSAAHLVIAGDGPLRPALERAAVDLGVEARAHFIGHRSDVEHVLAGIDVLILTSESEGVPGVLIEAQMAGCPTVTYPVGGVAEVIDDGETGVIIGLPDPRAMATVVAALLEDPDRRRRLAEEALRRSERFAVEHVTTAYVRAFESAVDARRRRSS